MDINIENEVDTIVLSHGHWDHGDGLRYVRNKKLITHPGAFIERFRKSDYLSVGLTLTKSEIEDRFSLTESKSPLQLSENLFYLGEIPRKNNFESLETSFVDDFRNDDLLPDDSAMAAVVNNELVVITGCSHSGICNITEHAMAVTGISGVRAVLGGFHLNEPNRQTLETIAWFKAQKGVQLFPSHCTGLPALAAFNREFGNSPVKTGMVLEF